MELKYHGHLKTSGLNTSILIASIQRMMSKDADVDFDEIYSSHVISFLKDDELPSRRRRIAMPSEDI